MSSLRQIAARKVSPLDIWNNILRAPVSDKVVQEMTQNFTFDEFYQRGYLEPSFIRKNFNDGFYKYLLINEKSTRWLWYEIFPKYVPASQTLPLSVDPLSEEGYLLMTAYKPKLTLDEYEEILKESLKSLLLFLSFILKNPGVVISSDNYSLIWDHQQDSKNRLQYRYILLLDENILTSSKPIYRLVDFYDDIFLALREVVSPNILEIEEKSPEKLGSFISDFIENYFPENAEFQEKIRNQLGFLIEPFELSVKPLNQDLPIVAWMHINTLVIISNRMIYFEAADAIQVLKTFSPNRGRFVMKPW